MRQADTPADGLRPLEPVRRLTPDVFDRPKCTVLQPLLVQTEHVEVKR